MTRKWKRWAIIGNFLFSIALLVYTAHSWSNQRLLLSDPNRKEDYVTNSDRTQNKNDEEICQYIISKNTRVNEYEYDFTSLAPQVDGSIPQEVAGNIKHFLFFVGTSRSGTSFVQRLLNSHPHAIVSDEMGILQDLRRYKNLNSRKIIAEKILKYVCAHLKSHRNGLLKGYLLSWKDKITLLGDKNPQVDSRWIFDNFHQFLKLYQKLSKIFGSLKVLSIARDPYEVVLKTVLANIVKSRGLKVAPDGTVPYDQVLDFDNMTGLYEVPESKLFDRILIIRKQVNVTVEMMNDPVYDVKLYLMDDFIDNGRKYLYELCDWLDLECFDNFVEYIMENKLEKSRSRKHEFFWPEKVKLAINKLIRNYPTYYLDGEKYIM